MAIVMLGIDLAKNVFALHGANEAGRVEMNARVPVKWQDRAPKAGGACATLPSRHDTLPAHGWW